ncbi:MAG: MoxR family ATPase [Firmicutes bacterium]|nr:MoxR family ATPase [Bacillota bacterium]
MVKINPFTEKIVANVEKVIVGKTGEVKLVMVALLCEGHLLVEDVPGVGKTMLARAIAKSIGCKFNRIQFTPDLLPSDIIGVNIFNQKTRDFEFKPGPIHTQIILADEINRATPKTQSALLECMEEKQISLDGVTHIMPKPFMVIATQNPIEYEGTFPLPESQLDRFFIRINMGYPDETAESEILERQKIRHPIQALEQVVTIEEVVEMQAKTREVKVKENLREYIVKIVQETRKDENLFLGASPRGSIALFRAAQAHALIEGRDFVIPDDIKFLAPFTLAHRMIGKSDGYSHAAGLERLVIRALEEIPVP